MLVIVDRNFLRRGLANTFGKSSERAKPRGLSCNQILLSSASARFLFRFSSVSREQSYHLTVRNLHFRVSKLAGLRGGTFYTLALIIWFCDCSAVISEHSERRCSCWAEKTNRSYIGAWEFVIYHSLNVILKIVFFCFSWNQNHYENTSIYVRSIKDVCMKEISIQYVILTK